jgi:hypothetical protein
MWKQHRGEFQELDQIPRQNRSEPVNSESPEKCFSCVGFVESDFRGFLLRYSVFWKHHDMINMKWSTKTTFTVLEKRILEDALTCRIHQIGVSLVENVVDVCFHPETTSQTTQDRV